MSTAAPNGQTGSHDQPDRTLQEILAACHDSAGYVLFVSRITNQRDPVTGEVILEHHYRRYQFPLEDTRQSAKRFAQAVQQELRVLAEEAPADETPDR